MVGGSVCSRRALGANRRASETREAGRAGFACRQSRNVSVRARDAGGACGLAGPGGVDPGSTCSADGHPGGSGIRPSTTQAANRHALSRGIGTSRTRGARRSPGCLRIITYGAQGARRKLLRVCVGPHSTGGTRRHAAARGVGPGNTWEVPGQRRCQVQKRLGEIKFPGYVLICIELWTPQFRRAFAYQGADCVEQPQIIPPPKIPIRRKVFRLRIYHPDVRKRGTDGLGRTR